MILSFKTNIDGKPTGFIDKILKHLGKEAVVEYVAKQPSFIRFALTVSIAEATPKKLTIRDDPHNRWSAGRKIHFATGARTKNYECFAEGECKAVAFLWITLYKNFSYCISIDQDNLSYTEAQQLATDDGFETIAEFLEFHVGTSIDPKNYWDHSIPDYPLKGMRKKIIYF
jgi:hypothetical protein